MNLAQDIKIIRQLPAKNKFYLVQWVAHILNKHPDVMKGITEEDLAKAICCREPVDNIAEILESKATELKSHTIETVNKESFNRWKKSRNARSAGKSSRTTRRY